MDSTTTSIDGLLPCPFCGQAPIVEPWHGGSATKVMINCPGMWPDEKVSECAVSPQVTGETPEEARDAWNTRTPAPSLGEDVVERVAMAVGGPLGNMNGGCFKPDNGRSQRGECADRDCYCARVTRHVARAAISSMRPEGSANDQH